MLKVNFPSWPSALTFFGVIYLEMNFWSLVTHHKQLHILYHFLCGSHEEILHLCDRCDSWSVLLAVPFLILMSMLWPSDTDLCDSLQYLLDYTDPNNISHIFSHCRACTPNFVTNFELLFWSLIERVTLIYIFQALIYTSKLHTSLDK